VFLETKNILIGKYFTLSCKTGSKAWSDHQINCDNAIPTNDWSDQSESATRGGSGRENVENGLCDVGFSGDTK